MTEILINYPDSGQLIFYSSIQLTVNISALNNKHFTYYQFNKGSPFGETMWLQQF